MLQVAALTPHIGAEVDGIDLARPLTAAHVAALEAALHTHLVLFFRDQALDVESLKAFGRQFGELDRHPSIPGHPEVVPVQADAQSTWVAGEIWHSDVSFAAEPPLGSMLWLHTVPPVGGDTLFASMVAAYEALSPRMQALLDGLTALHAGRQYGRAPPGSLSGEAVHPVVRTHPATGRKALYVSPGFTVRILELAEAESSAVLAFLFEHTARPDFQVRFRWQARSLAFWDNRATQHLAVWDYFPQVRAGHRITIRGDRPV